MRRTSITVCPERCGAEGNPAVSRKARVTGVPSTHGKKFCQLKTFFVNSSIIFCAFQSHAFGKAPSICRKLAAKWGKVNARDFYNGVPRNIARRGKPRRLAQSKSGGVSLNSRKKVLSAQNFFRELKYTINTATSAGLTPEMRPACPRFSGRILFSFCRASRRSPSMLS